MPNLLKETKDCMGSHLLDAEDITFIGSLKSGYSCTWEEFLSLADEEYDSGYGAPEVAQDLCIVFRSGTYMERQEYDGLENWRVVDPVVIPITRQPIKTLFADIGWKDLQEINH